MYILQQLELYVQKKNEIIIIINLIVRFYTINENLSTRTVIETTHKIIRSQPN